jgi:hypothetical protein
LPAALQEGAAAGPAPQFVATTASPLGGAGPEYDVVVCGGTLGIFAAVSLALRGLKVAVVERGALRGGRWAPLGTAHWALRR